MFKTNGTWASREQLRDPAGIIIWAVSPVQTTLDSYEGFGTVMVEFRFRVSERNKPGSELQMAIPNPLADLAISYRENGQTIVEEEP